MKAPRPEQIMQRQARSASLAAVVVDKHILGGTPVVAGTRVPAATVLAYLREGLSDADILRDYPSLPEQAIDAVRRWAGT